MPKVIPIETDNYPLSLYEFKRVKRGYWAHSFKSAKHLKLKHMIRLITQLAKIKMQNA